MILEIHDPMRKLDGPSSENVSCTDNLILICVTVIDIFKTSCSLRYETIAKWNHVTLFQQGERTAVWPTHVKSNIWDLKFPPLRHLGLKKKEIKESRWSLAGGRRAGTPQFWRSSMQNSVMEEISSLWVPSEKIIWFIFSSRYILWILKRTTAQYAKYFSNSGESFGSCQTCIRIELNSLCCLCSGPWMVHGHIGGRNWYWGWKFCFPSCPSWSDDGKLLINHKLIIRRW